MRQVAVTSHQQTHRADVFDSKIQSPDIFLTSPDSAVSKVKQWRRVQEIREPQVPGYSHVNVDAHLRLSLTILFQNDSLEVVDTRLERFEGKVDDAFLQGRDGAVLGVEDTLGQWAGVRAA